MGRKLSLDLLEDSDHGDQHPDTQENVSTSTVSTVDDIPSSAHPTSPPDQHQPKQVWNKEPALISNFKTFSNDHEPIKEQRHHPPRSRFYRSNAHAQSSEPSSVPSTSDEELERPRQLVNKVNMNGMSDTGGDTSTMESAQMVDRAKSFEYIPGENYQGQENSSSYEYLPGHLVSDNRPPTVLNIKTSLPDSLPIPSLAMAIPDNVDSVDALPPNLDVLSSELREKSKDLMAKNISQTKHFFKKLKDYIEYLSTPSLTIEDSKVKQELADRIMCLLTNEESRLGTSTSGITSRELSIKSLNLETLNEISEKKSGETSTRLLETIPSKRSSEARKKDNSRDSEFSSLTSEMKESNSSRISDWRNNKTKSELDFQLNQGNISSTEAVEIVQKLQRKRIAHMKKLKKEMKKLEKIDSLIVGAAVGKKIPDVSDFSVASSVTSVRSESISISLETSDNSVNKKSSKLMKATKTNTSVISTNLLSISPANERYSKSKSSGQPKSKTSAKSLKSNVESKSLAVAAIEEKENNPNQIVLEHISPIITRSPKRNHQKSPVRLSHHFPSNSSDTDTITLTDSNVETLNSNATFITKKSPKQRKRSPKKKTSKKSVPVAYYLPVDNMSPIRIGTRVLRENNGWMTSDNRNIISSHMASLDTQPLKKRQHQSSSTSTYSQSNNDQMNESMSLQQALMNRRKDFIRSCERRVNAMKKAKDARKLRSAKQEAWLEELARQSPRSQRMAEPCFTPVPVVRLFNHREMVKATRDKYQELPEVKFAKMDAKRNVRYKGNRLMSKIYSSRLQRKVVGRRQVSFSVHQLVV